MSTPQHFHFNKASGVWLTTAVILLLTFIFTLAHTPEPTYARPQAVIPACDPITSDTTWTTGNIYVLQSCSLFINNGATLTLQPGVIVKFAGTTSGIRVNGGLIAQGTAVQPVIITSYADDSAGGDTNGDGASSGTPGDWYGIIIPNGGTADLDHLSLRYAGANAFNAGLDGWSDASLELKEGGQLNLTNSDVRAGGLMGIYLNGTTSGSSLTPTIHNTHVADHSNTAYSYYFAIYQNTPNMQPSYANLSFSGNSRNEVTIGSWDGPLAQDVTLGGTNFGVDCGSTVCDFTIPTGRTLTILPDTLLDLRTAYGIILNGGGTLLAQGTPTQPITFTSKLAKEGDTGQYWMGIWAKPDSNLTLSHCDISYADDGNYGKGGLQIVTNHATVSDCHIHHNKRTGLHIGEIGNAVSTTLTNVRVTDNGEHGVYLHAYNTSTELTWDGGESSRNGYAGIQSYAYQGSLHPTLRNLSIVGNGTKGDTYDNRTDGISFSRGTGFHNPVLENLSITDNPGTAVRWDCDGSITTHNLTASGNGADELLVPGCAVTGGRTWDLGQSGLPVRVTGHIDLKSNSFVNIQPGTWLQFDRNQYDSPTELYIRANAALYALGTAESPIRFTGVTPTPGAWRGIVAAYANASLILNHCEVAYGGDFYGTNIRFYGNNTVSLGPIRIENCDIHHSSKRGVRFEYVTSNPIFHYNHLHDNAQESVVNFNAPPLDARQNYWGDLSGPYHATLNPSGQGGSVGDNVLFYPWLNAPETGHTSGELLVSTGGLHQYSPGQRADYVVQYTNLMSTTVTNASVFIRLPYLAYYVNSSDGGTYWPERHQVFWLLDDILPNEQGSLAVTIQYQWGIPNSQPDNSATLFVADNYNDDLLDLSPYEAYVPVEYISSTPLLTEAEWQAAIATSAELNTLYNRALADGFLWGQADRISLNNGDTVVQATMLALNEQKTRILYGDATRPYAVTFSPHAYRVEDVAGGIQWDLTSNTHTFFGAWSTMPDESFNNFVGPKMCLGAGCCLSNCLSKVALTSVAGKLSKAVNIALTTRDCYIAARTQTQEDLAKCAGQIKENMLEVRDLPAMGELIGITECLAQCSGNPNSNDCTKDLITCEPSMVNVYDWLRIPNKTVWRCDGGCYKSVPEYIPCALNDCCVPGVGCVSGSKAGANCQKTRSEAAKDPNDITGLTGDLLPGQTVTYTIRYENEGAGRAYGVYVVNPLSAVFDAASIQFVHGVGEYLSETRELLWYVGELGPKGDPDSEGVITYTVALTDGLPSGTVVANQATVYFASVPEETPTNTWVNLVAPLVATPQNVTTNYMTPLPITLSGRDISGLPLTYEISELPRGGTLTGTPPHVVYTPFENFTGADGFDFVVSNGTSASRVAQVYIVVSGEGDSMPPQVLWTMPVAGAVDVAASPTPIDGGTAVDLYTPAILVGFSERLAEETLTAVNVSLWMGSNTAVSTQMQFDPSTNQLVIFPRQALANGVYTVRLDTAVTDLAGNALATPYSWTFTVGDGAGSTSQAIYLPLITR